MYKLLFVLGVYDLTEKNKFYIIPRDFAGSTVVKNLPTNERDTGDVGSISGLGRAPGVGNDNPLQYSCLEKSMDRGAWQVTVHRVAKSLT